jgi:hypothetical protein
MQGLAECRRRWIKFKKKTTTPIWRGEREREREREIKRERERERVMNLGGAT